MKNKRALILLNLGTPQSPKPRDVGTYLKEFLMDPFVVDIPWIFRWILVHLLIVPRRKVASGKLYQSIWTERGSPLLFHLQDLRDRVVSELGDPSCQVEIAMRYGEPSIEQALRRVQAENCNQITVFPLYPQYAESSTRSSRREVKRVAALLGIGKIDFIPAFYADPSFIRSYVELVQAAFDQGRPEHLLMSFHGLPERHVKRTDRSDGRTHCLPERESVGGSCCDQITVANRDCYRAQCFDTARKIAAGVGLKKNEYSVSFQSRLGRTVWIRPYTDVVIPELARKGVKKLAVACPSFVADCLETLEENGIRGTEAFHSAGGKDFTAIPCPNSEATWVKAVVEIFRKFEERLTTERGASVHASDVSPDAMLD